jgi:uncharacterized protein YcbK (DUF882 family)
MLQDGQYFKVSELACHDGPGGSPGTPYPEAFADRLPELMSLLDKCRVAIVVPCQVISGYRTPAYNAELANKSAAHQVASGSYHVQGQAADIRPAGKTVAELHAAIMELYLDDKLPELGGIGFYPKSGWVHVDTGHAPGGHLRRWNGT